MKKQVILPSLIPVEVIQNKIYLSRGRKVMLDKDLAGLYGVTVKRLKEQVRRNSKRFPEDCVPRTYKERRFNLSSMVLCK
ncbi:MAG: ORF6N domain-containing protein [Candidatus Omnitrophota bacterium]